MNGRAGACALVAVGFLAAAATSAAAIHRITLPSPIAAGDTASLTVTVSPVA